MRSVFSFLKKKSILNKYYKILGLKDGAGLSDVKRQYVSLLKICHPDRNPNASTERFEEVTEAYKILKSHLESKNKRG